MLRGWIAATAAAVAALASTVQPASAAPIEPATVLRAVRSDVSFALPSGAATLRLRPSALVPDDARTTITDAAGRFHEVPRERFVTLAGEAAGSPRGTTALTVGDGWVAGIVYAHGRWYSVEPDSWARPRRTVVTTPRESALPAALLEGDVAQPFVARVNVGIANCVLFECDRLRALLILDADKFFADLGRSTCQSRQVAIAAGIQAIYRNDSRLKIDLSVPHINCRTSADLGPKGSRIDTYLDALAQKWNANTRDRSAVQLSAGFSFPGADPVGRAFMGGVCTRFAVGSLFTPEQQCAYGYSVYQAVGRPRTNYTASLFLRTKLAAHELAHNFDADHDSGRGCGTTGARRGPIMCPILQEAGRNVFSSESAAAMRAHAEAALGSVTGT